MTDEQWAAHVRMFRIILYRLDGGTGAAFKNATLELHEMLSTSFPALLPEWLKRQGGQP